MPMTRQDRDDWPTLTAIGVIATCLAAIGHEAVGHGGACLVAGGEVTLLTATHFSCFGGNPLVDVAGPAVNLVLALAALATLRLHTAAAPATRWFLFMLGVINLCWFAGEAVASPVVDGYDQAALARQLGWPPVWRAATLLLGFGSYFAAIRYGAIALRRDVQAPNGELRRRFGFTHTAATISFVLAGLCYARAPLAAAIECFMTIGVAVAPLWIAVGAAARSSASRADGRIARSKGWILLAIILFAAFALMQGRGIGRLA